jgi:hypothetical protein
LNKGIKILPFFGRSLIREGVTVQNKISLKPKEVDQKVFIGVIRHNFGRPKNYGSQRYKTFIPEQE